MIGFDMNDIQRPPIQGKKAMGEQNSKAFQDVASSPEGALDGFEQLSRIRDGRTPPPGMAITLGMEIVEIERGRVVFAAVPTPAHFNPAGVVHGGFTATLLDSCMTCAVHSTLSPGFGCTTLDLNVHYTRGASDKSGLLRAEGKIVHVGRQMATAEGRVTDPQGRLIAHATTSCLIFPLRGAA